jgi:hypothetical protein
MVPIIASSLHNSKHPAKVWLLLTAHRESARPSGQGSKRVIDAIFRQLRVAAARPAADTGTERHRGLELCEVCLATSPEELSFGDF